ncbi:response regulator [Virgibacillus pantothenticus]|uniref:response regulator n=1 Tax=Virgibacillus pantothenticus TaxID=1473 RepID=UPI000985852E|nr:response regulator [Virgibacillus pantothenticus]
MEKTILVVDDQPGICMLLTDILTEEGYRVETANTGKEGLEKINSSSFHLLMIDYHLPVLNAFEVLRQLEKTNNHIPAIVMTGMTETVIREKEDCNNIVTILSKPFNIKEVCQLVHSILN